ncbi:MAG TPA: tyrosine-type recombinase/integrase [Solirubrobacteraceae bacterium]|nr:tyrosine-type recombinase/integrase [Solirubrobacteraceae bacterium]
MSRRATGRIVEHAGKDGRVYRALRFTAYGKRRYLSLGPVAAAEAARELRHVLADVERGAWQPPRATSAPPEPEPIPTFHQFAELWWTLNHGQLAPRTQHDYQWRLERHLLPFFAEMQLDSITYDAVERYIAEKLAAGALGARSINMTVTLLATILESAIERELIARNPAKGKGRRVRERAPRRSYLDTAAQIEALLDAAAELDCEASSGGKHIRRAPMLAVLIFAGLRIGELVALRWRDVDLASGWLYVADAKTDAGRRSVKLRGALRDELLAVRAWTGAGAVADEFVFPTRTGGQQSTNNIRTRVLGRATTRANARLVAAGANPLPTKITPHSLRRTFASVLYALGEDPGVVMDELGHTDPALALRVYRQSMRRGEDEKAKLRRLVEGAVSADDGRRDENTAEAEDAGLTPILREPTD